MGDKMNGVGKALSALTLIIAAGSGAAMAHDTAHFVAPSAEAVAKATAIQLTELNTLGNGAESLAGVGDHDHGTDHDHALAAMNAISNGGTFNV